MEHKSYCPLNLGLEVFGDRWTLLIIRDLLFDDKQSFREILQSEEKIATNILSDRLALLEKEGIVVKAKDPGHKQKIIYLLTEKGIDLLPVIMAIGDWSLKYKPVGDTYKARAKALKRGGAAKIKELMKLHKKKLQSMQLNES